MKPVENKEQLKRLKFGDKVRHWLARRCWIKFDSKTAPFGRLVLVRLSNCDYQFMHLQASSQYVDGGRAVHITHWMDPPSL